MHLCNVNNNAAEPGGVSVGPFQINTLQKNERNTWNPQSQLMKKKSGLNLQLLSLQLLFHLIVTKKDMKPQGQVYVNIYI